MFARVVHAPADPVALARRLVGRAHLAVLGSSSHHGRASRHSFVACDPDDEVTSLDPLGSAPGDRTSPADLASFPHFIGFVPYEALRSIERPRWSPHDERPLAPLSGTRWLRYPAVARIDADAGRVLVAGRSRGAVDALAGFLGAEPRDVVDAPALQVIDDEPAAAHVARVERAIELIVAGDLYQVNLARRLGLRLPKGRTDTADLLALYAHLVRAAPSSFGALLVTPHGTLVSTSPELCLAAEASDDRGSFGALVTEPIKGTRPRGADAPDDARLARELDLDPKERAELAMIVDVERNDLHRVCAAGSVRLVDGPRVVTHRTIHHRVATLRGMSRKGVSREDVLRAMLPSGSVTGAPKIRAMEVIRTLEPVRRGLYTGAIGYQAHDGSMMLSMAIRTAVFGPGSTEGEYLVGGGIVVDSSPARELEETRWKSRQLQSLVARPAKGQGAM